MAKIYVEVPVQLRFFQTVSVAVEPAGDALTSEEVDFVRIAAEEAAWNWLEGKTGIGTGDSLAVVKELRFSRTMEGLSAQRYGGEAEAGKQMRRRKKARR